ncbi:MAG: hypothetical protein K8W52_39805 [Deltaproteobacteria bacterium]|nr:hypothetical protein [Deltaproteobacteria bacterium]
MIKPTLISVLAILATALTACGGGTTAPPADAAVTGCPPGALGCACASGDTCGASAAGEALQCTDEVCVSMRCAPGDTGCACRGGTDCTAATDQCQLGVCKPTDCAAGTAACDCLLDECNAGLYCDTSLGGGTCIDGAGFPGGACPANGLCHNQSRCDRDTATCVHCELGSQGCAPDHGVCNAGLVYAVGRCLPRDEVPPTAPRCYTRCTDDVVTPTGVMICDPEGFVAGCLPGLACDEGSCEPPGTPRVTCVNDAACPDHQRCLADNHCYSNCDTNTDCPSGLSCYLHACRMPCNANPSPGQACPADERCDMADGESGYCMPQVIDPTTGPVANGTFAVSATDLAFTLLEPASDIQLTTTSPVDEHFTVTKVRHRVYDRQGQPIDDPRAAAEPLWFVTLSSAGATGLPNGGLDILAPAGCGDACPALHLAQGAIPASWSRVEGSIDVASATMGTQTIQVSFQASVDGRWTGTMYYFASFPEVGLDAWRAGDHSQSNDVGNGLIAQWAAYRNGRLDGFRELQAILTATSTESWQWPSVTAACAAGNTRGACYLYDTAGTAGIRQYVDNLAATPIPSGPTQYPIAFNLRRGPLDAAGNLTYTGIIDSSVALHYGGNPRIDLAFPSAHAPDDTTQCDSDGVPGDCVSYLAGFSSDIYVGARIAAVNGACPAGMQLVSVPWLVPGFTAGTRNGMREECRESTVPFAGGDPRNANLTVGNPVADGRSIKRQLRLVDGAMIDQQHLFVIFQESVASSLRGPTITTYGYMLLERSGQPVRDAELTTSTTGTSSRGVTGPLPGRTSCDAALATAAAALPAGQVLPLSMPDPDRASLMLTGRAPGTLTPLTAGVHYLCVDTGLFDGGPGNSTGAASDVRVACPTASNVRYFVLPPSFTQASVAALACQQDHTCGVQLQQWITSNLALTLDPVWACESPTATTCSDNRYDLRAGKIFYPPGPAVFVPLESAVEDAFRYKEHFRSSTNRSVGFVPVPCIGSGALTPYCYDAAKIQATADRVDCLLSIYAAHASEWHNDAWLPLRTFLTSSLAVHPAASPSSASGADGFERLDAELSIMLGDDALTHALSSRFDLAAANGGAFFGAQFENGGMNVSGVAGYEMRAFHQAVQYYESATDRFFTKVAPVIFAAIASGDVGANHVVSPALVSSYLERILGGSAKKAAAWSYIADRYRGFNRPDLARSVMQRAYMGTYLESMFLSRLMLDIADNTDGQNRGDIVIILNRAQHEYESALARMREVYESISRDGERFGFSPDFIPFPAVDDTDTRFANAFEAALGLARMRTDTARRFEDDAVTNSHGFEADSAAFQSELVQISVTKEARLSEICGQFDGDDGRVHAAISRHAYLSDRTAAMGDPCGFVGNGELYDRMADIALLQSDVTEFQRRVAHLYDRIALEQERVTQQCANLGRLLDLQITERNTQRSLQRSITDLENGISLAERTAQHVGQMLALTKCDLLDCEAVPSSTAAYGLAAAASEYAVGLMQTEIQDQQDAMTQSQIRELTGQIDTQCTAIRIDSAPVVADLVESIQQLRHDVNQTLLRVKMDLATMTALRLEARRTAQEEADAEALAIDVEAARNDPNIRVYMNTAMINADRSFNRALEHAFRATRLLEYYESQSYAHADDLYLIRMVAHGDYNLDNYLDELEDEYESFRGQYRNRAHRAIRLSMANDIMQIPTLGADGHSLSPAERTALMRARLLDPRLLDSRGRRTYTFSTTLDQFAPCTFGQQIDYVEVMFSGADLGDPNASVMLWQTGTGVVERADQGQNFHRLPPALIVATPRRDLDSAFDPSVYRNYGMRERPVVNTSWTLVFDEHNPQNRDVHFDQLNDIYIYIYYTDFTNPAACQ